MQVSVCAICGRTIDIAEAARKASEGKGGITQYQSTRGHDLMAHTECYVKMYPDLKLLE